jgi:hypothetical protein
MEQLAVVASLRSGAEEEARRLIELGPPFDPGERGFSRHSVFLSANEVVFVFEAEEVEGMLDALMTDPSSWVVQSTIEAWRPVLEGEPRVAPVAFSWRREVGSALSPPIGE